MVTKTVYLIKAHTVSCENHPGKFRNDRFTPMNKQSRI